MHCEQAEIPFVQQIVKNMLGKMKPANKKHV